MSRYIELRNKEVINIYDGCRMGYVCDVEFDLESGNIKNLIIPYKTGFLSFFGKHGEHIIPWEKIKKIGDDIIFVEFCL